MDIKKLSILYAAVLLGIVSCSVKDYETESPFDNVVYIEDAKISPVDNFTFKNTLETATKTVSAALAYPADTDVEAKLSVDQSLVRAYNERHSSDFAFLESKHWNLPSSKLLIPKRKVISNSVEVDFNALNELELDRSYLLPVTISPVSGGVDLLEGSSTLWYVVTRSSAITTAVSLKDNYFEVPGFEASSPTAAVANDIDKLTFEAIIKVNSFRDINSIMGIEQYCLLRLGDSGFPKDQLQFCSPGDVKFPKADKTKALLDNTWYHIALVYDTENRTAVFYIDGQEQSRIEDYGNGEAVSLGKQVKGKDFMFKIGHSYGEPEDYSRQLDGEICEVRVWRMLRSQEDIFASMYDVDPATPGLVAYWKFNEGSGDTVRDWTGNGNDAVAHKSATWPTGVLVPKKNQ